MKQRVRPMLGFKRFDNAAVTISGIELAEKIKKGNSRSANSVGAMRRWRTCGTRHSPPEPHSKSLKEPSPTHLTVAEILHQSP